MDQNNPKHKLTSTLFIEERESLYSRSLNVFDKGKTQSMVLMSSFRESEEAAVEERDNVAEKRKVRR